MAETDRLLLARDSGALALPEDGPIAVLHARPRPFLGQVEAARLRLEQPLRPVCDALAPLPVVEGELDGTAAFGLVEITRSRAETMGAIARGLTLLPPGAILAVDGSRNDGIDGVAKQLAAVLPLAGVLPKAHGRLVWFERPAVLPPDVDAWAVAARPAPNRDGFVTRPGLFSADGIDPGSAALAAVLPGRLSGRVADLGAGWGWLAARALAENPGVTTLDLHEADARALAAARANVTDPRAAFHWSDVTRLGRSDGPVDAVITNPPFHQGRAAEPALGQAFIAAAARLLKPSGRLLLVANRRLPYEAALGAAFTVVEPLADTGSFKVIAASRPRSTRPGRR